MKKISQLFLPLLFLPFFTNAQFNIGIKGGMNYAKIDDNFSSLSSVNEDIFKARTAYHLGIFAQTTFYERLTLRGELLYSFEGGKIKDSLNPLGISSQGYIDYLNLPLLVQVNILKFLHIEAGIEPGIIINGKNFLFDKTTEVGAIFGAGIHLGSRFGINMRYVHGLTDVFQFTFTDINGNPIDIVSGKSKMFQLSLEIYLFN